MAIDIAAGLGVTDGACQLCAQREKKCFLEFGEAAPFALAHHQYT